MKASPPAPSPAMKLERDRAITSSLKGYAAENDTAMDPFWEDLAWRSVALNMDEEDQHW